MPEQKIHDLELRTRTNELHISEITRRMDSYHEDNKLRFDKVFDKLDSIPTEKDLRLLRADILEHINKVGDKQRKDLELSAEECKKDYESLKEGHEQIEKRLDKAKYTMVGGFTVITLMVGFIGWVTNVFVK